MEALKLDKLHTIERAAGDDLPDIAGEIKARRALFLRHKGCVFVLRPEEQELVIVCAEGKNLRQAAPDIVSAANKAGFLTMRFHTKRRALARLLKPWGFVVFEKRGPEIIYKARV